VTHVQLREEEDVFERERAGFRLLCVCEDCVHFEAHQGGSGASSRDSLGCSLGFPTDEHRATALVDQTFVFCKCFEAT
jgi:hypothetical protein